MIFIPIYRIEMASQVVISQIVIQQERHFTQGADGVLSKIDVLANRITFY